jgi:hypothetical protein
MRDRLTPFLENQYGRFLFLLSSLASSELNWVVRAYFFEQEAVVGK